jgi:transcription elongation factor Elf1
MSNEFVCASCNDDRVVQHDSIGRSRRLLICLSCGEVRVFERQSTDAFKLVAVDMVDESTKRRIREVTAASPMRPLFTRSRGGGDAPRAGTEVDLSPPAQDTPRAGSELPAFKCPTCGVACKVPDVQQRPAPGEFAICESCTSCVVFDDQMRLRHPTDADLRELFRQARRAAERGTE